MEHADKHVVMFNPAPRSGLQAHRRVELPLSVLCPATPVFNAGYHVTIVDQFADPDWKARFDSALATRPICLGVTCMTGPQIRFALDACRLAKEKHPDLPVVWGGIHASLLPQQTLENPLIDIAVIGEGEATFLELVQALEEGRALDGVAGIYFKRDNETVPTPPRGFVDIDKEPPLAYISLRDGVLEKGLVSAIVSGQSKKKLISMIDESLVDPTGYAEMTKTFQPAAAVLGAKSPNASSRTAAADS